MISKYSHKHLIWIDLEKPDEKEIIHIFEEQYIPEYIKDMYLSNLKNDKMYSDENYIFVCLPFLHENNLPESRLVLIATDDFIISVHKEKTSVLNDFFKEIELYIISNDKLIIDNNKLLLTYLIKNLYINSEKQLVETESTVSDYHRNIISAKKKNKVLKVLLFISLGVIILLSIYAFINI